MEFVELSKYYSVTKEKFLPFAELRKMKPIELTHDLQLVNEFDNVELGKKKTNNFGELLAFYFAVECAQKLNLKKIFGDSQLIINYWTKGIFKADSLPEATISLILKATKNREKFELNGASVEHISGNINPADLGFHK